MRPTCGVQPRAAVDRLRPDIEAADGALGPATRPPRGSVAVGGARRPMPRELHSQRRQCRLVITRLGPSFRPGVASGGVDHLRRYPRPRPLASERLRRRACGAVPP